MSTDRTVRIQAIRWNDDRLLCFPDLPQMYGCTLISLSPTSLANGLKTNSVSRAFTRGYRY